MKKYICPDCSGDGKETCHNPDHGFYGMVTGISCDEARTGCPLCGHDPKCKVINGGNCDTCNGLGYVNYEEAMAFIRAYDLEYDMEPEEL